MHRGERLSFVFLKRRNWLTYSELNSCWASEELIFPPQLIWASQLDERLSLSLIFCSISPGNLFRLGGERKLSKRHWPKRSTSHRRLQPIRWSLQRQLRPSATTWLFTVCERKLYHCSSNVKNTQKHSIHLMCKYNRFGGTLLTIIVFSALLLVLSVAYRISCKQN